MSLAKKNSLITDHDLYYRITLSDGSRALYAMPTGVLNIDEGLSTQFFSVSGLKSKIFNS